VSELPHDPISRRQVVGLLAAPLLAPLVSCSHDMLAPHQPSHAPSRAAGASTSVTLIGAGDTHTATAKFSTRSRTAAMVKTVLDADPNAWAFNAGDLVQHGTAQQYQDFYTPTWGQFKERTLFTMGNHDREKEITARHYYEYTGAERYYARTLGSWRVYSLNSESAQLGGAPADEQTAWLKRDIALHKHLHILAMWHIPMFSNVCGFHGRPMTWPGKVGAWWQVLQENGAELVISGHAHRWERFRRMLRNGTASSLGVRQFVLGTGGVATMPLGSKNPNCENVTVAMGVVRCDLHPDSYEWKFTDINGVVRDQGRQTCRKAPPVV
jgi:acid phosphatase type 7